MFSGLASYFGYGAEEETPEQQQQVEAGEQPTRRVSPPRACKAINKLKAEERLQTEPDSDDEWMVINKSSSVPSTPTPTRLRTISNEMTTSFTSSTKPISSSNNSDNLNNSPCTDSKNNSMSSSQTDSETKLHIDESSDSDTVLSDISSLPEKVEHPSMCESWLVTPPPCFTVGGNSPLRQVTTNPMENLLIEHPSMSVYGARGRPSSTGHHSDISESSNDAEMAAASCSAPCTTVSRGRKRGNHTTMKGLPPRRPNAVAARAGLLAQVQTVNLRSMQKSQKRKEARKLSKKNVDRSNRVKYTQSLPKSHSRKQYMSRPSGLSNVSNDRKTNC